MTDLDFSRFDPEIELSTQQVNFLDDYKKGLNLYLCGEAGSGKSTVINELVHLCEHQKKNVAICAPTGIAAVNVRGTTIHKLFGFPLGLLGTSTIDNLLDSDSREEVEELLLKLDVLIIDEISMVRSDLFRAMDYYLRNLKKEGTAFGGVQVIVVGDFSQIPPVVTRQEKKILPHRYCFVTDTWGLCNFKIHHLTTNYRARSDLAFTECLRGIKVGSIKSLKEVNSRCVREVPDHLKDKVIHLCTINNTARLLNNERLKKLSGKGTTFEVSITGKVKQSDMSCEQELHLKLGARVMLIANLHKLGIYNGEVGTVTKIHPQSVTVQFDNGKLKEIARHTWNVYSYKRAGGDIKKETSGTFSQIPLKLAYAITIHKSQGKTLAPIKLELGTGCFEHGQFYVAVSRARSFDNIYMDDLAYPQELIVDKAVLKFLEDNNIS